MSRRSRSKSLFSFALVLIALVMMIGAAFSMFFIPMLYSLVLTLLAIGVLLTDVIYLMADWE